MYGGLPITTSKPPVPCSGLKTSGNSGLPVERPRVDRGVGHDAVADAQVMVQAGQLLALDRRLDPEAELGDVDGFVVQVDAVEVLLEDLAVQVEELGESPQLLDPVVGLLVLGVELVEGFDQERPAAAGRVEDPNRAQLVLPVEPERRAAHPVAVP